MSGIVKWAISMIVSGVIIIMVQVDNNTDFLLSLIASACIIGILLGWGDDKE